MTTIQTRHTTENNEPKSERIKRTDNKSEDSVKLPDDLKKLSELIDKFREMEGDTSMFRSRFQLPYSSPGLVHPPKKT